MAYKYMDSQLRRDIPRSNEQSTIEDLIEELNVLKYIWFDICNGCNNHSSGRQGQETRPNQQRTGLPIGPFFGLHKGCRVDIYLRPHMATTTIIGITAIVTSCSTASIALAYNSPDIEGIIRIKGHIAGLLRTRRESRGITVSPYNSQAAPPGMDQIRRWIMPILHGGAIARDR